MTEDGVKTTSEAPDFSTLWTVDDPLARALDGLRMDGTLYCQSELRGDWAIDLPATPNCLIFHLVLEGRMDVMFSEGIEHSLTAGEIALVPHGLGHRILSSASMGDQAKPFFDLKRELINERFEVLKLGDGPEETILLCGVAHFEDPITQRVISLLPRWISLDHSQDGDWLRAGIHSMAREARSHKKGRELLLARFSDLLVIQAIRHWLETAPAAHQGWIGALQDPTIAQALGLVHGEVTRPWTLQEIAERVGVSRSAFAARFRKLVGETPMNYIRSARMSFARQWLRHEKAPIYQLAELLGYESEAAFSRAFKKETGQAPGAIRRE